MRFAINKDMDKQRLLELAGVEGKPVTEAIGRETGVSWDDALKVIAANLVDGAHLEELLNGNEDADRYAEELMDGRWKDQLYDYVRDELEERKKRAQ